MDFRVLVSNLFYMGWRSAKTPQWYEGSYSCTLKKFAFSLNWFSLSHITNSKVKLIIQLPWSSTDPAPIFSCFENRIIYVHSCLLQIVIPEDKLCSVDVLVCFLLWLGPHCLPHIRTGIQWSFVSWFSTHEPGSAVEGKNEAPCSQKWP